LRPCLRPFLAMDNLGPPSFLARRESQLTIERKTDVVEGMVDQANEVAAKRAPGLRPGVVDGDFWYTRKSWARAVHAAGSLRV
jgi:hypothetical protein